MDKRGEAVFPAEDCACECEVGYYQLIHRCAMGLLEDDDEGLMFVGQVFYDTDLAGGDALGVQLQDGGSTLLFDRGAAAPWEGRFPRHSALNSGLGNCSVLTNFASHIFVLDMLLTGGTT
ncbi:unnamed protein product [Clavelina lepadiformis]|uniref:Uncharacterized protein n=1 Tax=Clavelina lepadiformis TaxID=159417 RepID=A0ABP0FU76_CLALP